jgi:hypothetical protein
LLLSLQSVDALQTGFVHVPEQHNSFTLQFTSAGHEEHVSDASTTPLPQVGVACAPVFVVPFAVAIVGLLPFVCVQPAINKIAIMTKIIKNFLILSTPSLFSR